MTSIGPIISFFFVGRFLWLSDCEIFFGDRIFSYLPICCSFLCANVGEFLGFLSAPGGRLSFCRRRVFLQSFFAGVGRCSGRFLWVIDMSFTCLCGGRMSCLLWLSCLSFFLGRIGILEAKSAFSFYRHLPAACAFHNMLYLCVFGCR